MWQQIAFPGRQNVLAYLREPISQNRMSTINRVLQTHGSPSLSALAGSVPGVYVGEAKAILTGTSCSVAG